MELNNAVRTLAQHQSARIAKPHVRRGKITLSSLAGFGLIAIAIVVAALIMRPTDGGGGKTGGDATPVRPEGSLTAAESRLATVSMAGHWVEVDIVFNDRQDWTGSGVVIDDSNGKLLIMTNSHCLGIPDFTDPAGSVEVGEYVLGVRLAGKDTGMLATRFAESTLDGPDMGLLEVPIGDMRSGIDYVVAPICGRECAEVGAVAIAIGAPRGLDGTETRGVISAQRPRGKNLTVIQTDALIKPGSSGGPLFVQKEEWRSFCGINTFGGEGIGFAYCADEYPKQDWKWFESSPRGAVAALKMIYRREATVAE